MKSVYFRFKCSKCKQKHAQKYLHSIMGSSWKGRLISFDLCPACYEQEIKAIMERCAAEKDNEESIKEDA